MLWIPVVLEDVCTVQFQTQDAWSLESGVVVASHLE